MQKKFFFNLITFEVLAYFNATDFPHLLVYILILQVMKMSASYEVIHWHRNSLNWLELRWTKSALLKPLRKVTYQKFFSKYHGLESCWQIMKLSFCRMGFCTKQGFGKVSCIVDKQRRLNNWGQVFPLSRSCRTCVFVILYKIAWKATVNLLHEGR